MQQFTDPIKNPLSRDATGHQKLTIAPSPVTASALQQATNITQLAPLQYGRPNKSNFPTIDSAKKPNCLFQVTVSQTHEVNVRGLLAAVDALATVPPQAPILYFVVPPDQFQVFSPGPFAYPDNSAKTALNVRLRGVQYWVLQLYEQPTPPSISPHTLIPSTAPSIPPLVPLPSLPPTTPQSAPVVASASSASGPRSKRGRTSS